MNTQEQDRAKQALAFLANAIVDAVKVAGDRGAPSGHLYAALMGKVTLDQYQQIMGVLVKLGKLRQEGLLYFAN